MKNRLNIVFTALLLTVFSPAAFPDSSQPVDLRIVVDISADVRKAAPDNQHLNTIKLMINSLPAGSRAGIWTYGMYVNHLVQHDNVTSTWLQAADISIDKIRPVASNRNIYSALKKAAFDFGLSSDLDRHILLLSSGNIDVGDDQANRKSRDLLLASLLPKLIGAGIKVHSLALSANSGSGLLNTISKETAGYAFVANNPDQFIDFGQSLVNSFNPQNYIPIHDNRFAIDDYVSEFILTLIAADVTPVSVVSPSGKKFTNQKHAPAEWFQDKRFVRMRVNAPELGQWRISGQVSPESRVYVRGGSRIEVSGLATAYITNENIIVSASDQNPLRIPGKKGFSDDTRVAITIGSLGGREGSVESSQYVFSQIMTPDPDGQADFQAELQGLTEKGLYRFATVIKTLDYERGLDRLVQVNELFTMDVSTTKANDNFAYNILIIPADHDIDLDKTRVIATVSDSAGKLAVRTVEFVPVVGWQLTLEDDNKSAEYKIELDFKGSTFSGRPLHYRPKPLIIELPRTVLKTPSAIDTDSGLRTPSEVKQADTTSMGAKTETPVSTGSQQPVKSAPNAQSDKGNGWILLVAGVCLILGSGIVLFYFWQPIKKSFTGGANLKGQSRKEPDASGPQEIASTVTATSSVPESTNKPPVIQTVVEPDRAEFRSSEQPATRSIDLTRQRTEGLKPKPKEPEPALDDDFEVDLGFDLDMAEETELASEWRDLDAESNLASKAVNDIEIDFDEPAKKG